MLILKPLNLAEAEQRLVELCLAARGAKLALDKLERQRPYQKCRAKTVKTTCDQILTLAQSALTGFHAHES